MAIPDLIHTISQHPNSELHKSPSHGRPRHEREVCRADPAATLAESFAEALFFKETERG
jgi:hypothetical protein